MNGLADPLFPFRSKRKSRRSCKLENGRHQHGVMGKEAAQNASVYIRMQKRFLLDKDLRPNVLADRDVLQ